MAENTTATAPEVPVDEAAVLNTEPPAGASLKIETDAEFPWAVVIVDGVLRVNPGVPAFRTKEDAERYVAKLREDDPTWPEEGQVDYEWRPDLEDNPNSMMVRELLDEVDQMPASDNTAADHAEAIEKLLAAQVYATLAVRDQIAGFGCDFGGLPVRFSGGRR